MAAQCSALAVNAPLADPFRAVGLPVIPDAVPGQGPLGGILAAMDWAAACGAGRVVTVAVDTPFLPPDLVARLARIDAPAVLAEAADGLHPVAGLWSVGLRDDLRAALAQSMRKVRLWADSVGAQSVLFEDAEAFFNVNTPEDLAKADMILQARTAAFDTILVVDWSARAAPSPAKPSKDAIHIGMARNGRLAGSYHRTRAHALLWLTGLMDAELRAGRRVLVVFDFPFAYPMGFGRAVTGSDDPLALWAELARRIEDDDRNANNRFNVAAALNSLFEGDGPFWGHPQSRAVAGLPFRKPAYAGFAFDERRRIEHRVPRAKSCFQLMGAGSVGSQALLGIPRLQALRDRYGDDLAVAPFQEADRPIVLAELYPGLIDGAIKSQMRDGDILDAVQVRSLARALSRLSPARLNVMLAEGDPVEGWILGHGHEAELIRALA
ncbi:Molybdopterin-guanine dinucleotide biosynthesis protein MobA [Roseibacterium elongatum DSM 19469]|uniref:Molybdopterin-guanine dinucleotide biosynthesis protein MobA n=2 Tax=Roseicyclus elongatus TaxID=159346 RepID=W8RRM5_9RHOB|nr:Molybdopterin-guanine dinucleotide biosynthesis protein MobA [Roseibacterium elongatum DSM 19469]